jgi:hypothetical protein
VVPEFLIIHYLSDHGGGGGFRVESAANGLVNVLRAALPDS